ncbi:hypothetical protein [Streptomyces sp. W4I9-2]|uniref:hypothetical protein n=1 Tax=Streptomyces sp. W4I9-2 TaxID=3042297 RepID=UPI00278A6E2A|nr:hypothetical protein [Streptomyces sp. W4I9-2]MDQ0700971.1 hypothetical protein [Streptomyces sp. W4I9-2]
MYRGGLAAGIRSAWWQTVVAKTPKAYAVGSQHTMITDQGAAFPRRVVVLHHLAGCIPDRTREATGHSQEKVRHPPRTWSR